jgi:hypothetical protein
MRLRVDEQRRETRSVWDETPASTLSTHDLRTGDLVSGTHDDPSGYPGCIGPVHRLKRQVVAAARP